MVIIGLIVLVLIAVCIFVIARWLIVVAFRQAGVDVPTRVAGALALLIALAFVLWGWQGPLWDRF